MYQSLPWMNIPGYEKYQINELGTVRTVKMRKDHRTYLKSGIRKNGYRQLSLYQGKKRKTEYLHRLLAITFLEIHNCVYNQINHLNGNKLDNRLCNLAWCSAKQNIQHAYDTRLNQNRGKTKWIVDWTGKKIYRSVRSAATGENVKYNTLKNMLNGHRTNTSGLFYLERLKPFFNNMDKYSNVIAMLPPQLLAIFLYHQSQKSKQAA